MLLTHSCIALSTLFNVFPFTLRVVHKQGAVRTLQNSFIDVVDLDAKQGRRQDATFRDQHLLLMQLRQSGTHFNLEIMFRQEVLNKPGEWPHKPRSQRSARMTCFHACHTPSQGQRKWFRCILIFNKGVSFKVSKPTR